MPPQPSFDVLPLREESSLVALLHAETLDPRAERTLTMAEREVLSSKQRAAIALENSKNRKAWTRGAALHRFLRADGDRAALSRVTDFLRIEMNDCFALHWYERQVISRAALTRILLSVPPYVIGQLPALRSPPDYLPPPDHPPPPHSRRGWQFLIEARYWEQIVWHT